MNIEPTYTSVGNLFGYRPIYLIPKYQRAYAWEDEQLTDFTKDLTNCIVRRKAGAPIDHFLGGILSVKHTIHGAVNQHKYEIIDGQQRLATIHLLVSVLLNKYRMLLSSGDSTNNTIIERRIDEVTSRFITFTLEIHRVTENIRVLTLSKADDVFYNELIQGITTPPSRNSHKLISSAFKRLSTKIDEIIDINTSLESKIDDLEIIQQVLDQDFTILHMVTENKSDAYRLFQVINDRGTNLTDGDLLRAKTLEKTEGFSAVQDAIEKRWDEILSDHPTDTNNYLNWIYESHTGQRPAQNALFDIFLDKFFPQHHIASLTLPEAEAIKHQLDNTYNEIQKCKKLVEGQWVFLNQQPITSWDRSRLNILMVELGHTLSIPLFLAASLLDHRIFSEIVQIVEKTFFKYKVICNQHVTPLKKIYAEEAIQIRQNPQAYNSSALKSKLRALVNSKTSDSSFKNSLLNLEYKSSGGSNKPLKYFLMTIEYYYTWYKGGGVGDATCLDKSRVYDFAGTSIEHIYPRNATGTAIEATLEPLKNTLGNLTIMDPAQNTLAGNEIFADKKSYYANSSVVLTQEIAANASWSQCEIQSHHDNLINIAFKVFNI